MTENSTQYPVQSAPGRLSIVNDEAFTPPVERRGFLPFPTNAFDRIFVSGLCLVAIHLLWLRLVEAYLPLWGAMIVSIALGVFIFKRG